MPKKQTTSLEIKRHSLAHIMAAAVLELYPKVKLGIGPTIANGFYYDFDLPTSLTPEDLPKIEKKMHQLISQDLVFKKTESSIAVALNKVKKLKQDYKEELIKDLQKEGKKKVSFYQTGDFVDLCQGPHVKSTKELKGLIFKLTNIAGAYWRGKETRPMLQRIYGLAFANQKDLAKHLKQLAQAEQRDHRVLGQELDLFHIDSEVGPGMPLWHPNGAMLLQIIQDFWAKEHLQNGYQLVKTPHIAKLHLWKTSGHWGFYRDNMFPPVDVEGSPYIIKPMNCPFHMKIFNSDMRSYRDLPIRWAELGTVYRNEKSGVLHGLMRVRSITQDDAHIFCRLDQLEAEISRTLAFSLKMLKTFGFKDFDIYLSTQPEKFVGKQENWDKATKAIEKALKKSKIKYIVDKGEGAFYGPKIDIKIKDSLERAWQCTTIQVDFNLPERFKINYIDKGGKKTQPIMIHRALLGAIERFIGILIEHYAGAFPVWLAPLQAQIIPVGQGHIAACEKLATKLRAENLRVAVDDLNETVGYKIRKAEKQKVPYMIVIGDKEKSLRILAVRQRGDKQVKKLSLDKFVEQIEEEIEKKRN